MKKIKKARIPYDIKFTSLIPRDSLIRANNSISKKYHHSTKKTFVKGYSICFCHLVLQNLSAEKQSHSWIYLVSSV